MIPALNQSGVLPPYINPDGPGASPTDMTPFRASSKEFVDRFLFSPDRKALLGNWLDHRNALRKIGITQGTQWLDGSFVEDKTPKDIDVVTYFSRPKDVDGNPISNIAIQSLMNQNRNLFDRSLVKASYSLDAFFLDLNGNSRSLVNQTRYFCGLFSHQRVSDIWKGMVEVDLDDLTEPSAMQTVKDWVP